MKTYTRILRVAGYLIVAAIAVHWLTAGTDEITRSLDKFSEPTYSEQLADQHDCWTGGRQTLPNAAVVTFTSDVAARYTTDPTEVDLAFRAALGEDVPNVYSVTALCLD